MFSLRNKKNYLSIILNTLLMWSSGLITFDCQYHQNSGTITFFILKCFIQYSYESEHFIMIHLLKKFLLLFLVQTFGKRHLEYLQLFEKEMTANYLRRMKEKEKSGLERTVSMLQKRYAILLCICPSLLFL